MGNNFVIFDEFFNMGRSNNVESRGSRSHSVRRGVRSGDGFAETGYDTGARASGVLPLGLADSLRQQHSMQQQPSMQRPPLLPSPSPFGSIPAKQTSSFIE